MKFSRLLSLIERPGDTILVSINETCQSIVHEAWQYGIQVAQTASIIALGLVNKTAAEKNLELSQRIGPPKRPNAIPADSPFISLLKKFNSNKNAQDQSPESSKQIIKTTISREHLLEEENTNDVNPVNSPVHNNDDNKNDPTDVHNDYKVPDIKIHSVPSHLHRHLNATQQKNNHLRRVQNFRNLQTKSYDNIIELIKEDAPNNVFRKAKEDRSDELLLRAQNKKKIDEKNFKKLHIKNSYFVEKSQDDDPFCQWHCASTTPYSSPTISKAKRKPTNPPPHINFNDITNLIQPPKENNELSFKNGDSNYQEIHKESSVKKEQEAMQEDIIKDNKVAAIFELEKLKDEENPSFVVNKTTGLFEDLRINILLFIDYYISGIRSIWHSFFLLISSLSLSILFPIYIARKTLAFIYLTIKSANWIIRWILNALFQPKKAFLRSTGFDQRTKEQIVKDSGYPYKTYDVITEDGYILTLERLPNPKSRDVVYFQHGVIDSGFTWIAAGSTSSIALAAYDHGFDVFLGNFRGNKPIRHLNPKISSAKYWDFSVNEHAFLDMPAFISKIRALKDAELDNSVPESRYGMKEKYRISAISHSMGGMATLMYIIKSNLDQTPHYLSTALLMSPAGIHSDTPKMVRFWAPILDWAIYFTPWVHSLSYPSELVRVIMTKIMQDVKNSSPTRDLFTYFITKIIGGNLDNEHSLFKANAIQWIFDGTPIGVFRHFRQLISSGEFKSYDYGKKKNMQIYSSPEPINFLANYHKIDLPIFFMMGLLDTLISPANIMQHYSTLASIHPHLAYLKVFPKAGHVDFTLGMDEEMTFEILSVLKAKLSSPS